MTETLTTPLGPISLVAIIYTTIIYINLSRKLGAVTKMRPYYRGFIVALAFLSMALMGYIARNAAYLAKDEASNWFLSSTFGLFFFHIPLFIGIAIDVSIIWRYWSWLLTEEK